MTNRSRGVPTALVSGLALAWAILQPALALAVPSRHALVVGIDTYPAEGAVSGGRRFLPLHGAVADARAFAALLEKLGFDRVTLLVDRDATRQGILDGLAALASDARPGDVRVFFYAGHGSQVRNSLSPELDLRDESFVPVDVGSVKGGVEVRDLRDKELAKALNAIIDTGALLTVGADSCHSGSVTRGPKPNAVGAARGAPWDERDVKDGSRPAPPETRGALIISAAQDEQPAQEMGSPTRGAFTTALVAALSQEGAADLPARALFQKVADAVHVATHGSQVPVLGGDVQRYVVKFF